MWVEWTVSGVLGEIGVIAGTNGGGFFREFVVFARRVLTFLPHFCCPLFCQFALSQVSFYTVIKCAAETDPS